MGQASHLYELWGEIAHWSGAWALLFWMLSGPYYRAASHKNGLWIKSYYLPCKSLPAYYFHINTLPVARTRDLHLACFGTFVTFLLCPCRFLLRHPAWRCATWRCLSPSSTTVTMMSSNGCGTSAALESMKPAAKVVPPPCQAANSPLPLPSILLRFFFSPPPFPSSSSSSHNPYHFSLTPSHLSLTRCWRLKFTLSKKKKSKYVIMHRYMQNVNHCIVYISLWWVNMNQPVSERKRRVMRECPGERTRGLKGPPPSFPPCCVYSVLLFHYLLNT